MKDDITLEELEMVKKIMVRYEEIARANQGGDPMVESVAQFMAAGLMHRTMMDFPEHSERYLRLCRIMSELVKKEK